jgi:mannose-6-phosphate isomerase
MTGSLAPLRPRPAPSVRPWAGTRLDPAGRIGELWLAGPDSIIDVDGGAATLDDLAARTGLPFLGDRAVALLGNRFPLLVKLIDAGDWLSLQVHPDDALARELHGPDALGKTEAWLVLDAAPGAALVTGPRRDLGPETLGRGIADGSLGLEACEVRPARPGDALLLGAGTMHAIGGGTFVYEIEQPSDLTYRISDWGRPATPGRLLHREESARAVRPGAHAELRGSDWRLDMDTIEVPEFRLELVKGGRPHSRRPRHSLEVLTAVRGTAVVAGESWRERLETFETLVIPASGETYVVEGSEDAVICAGSIP